MNDFRRDEEFFEMKAAHKRVWRQINQKPQTNDIRTIILDALALVAFIGAMVLLLALGSMR